MLYMNKIICKKLAYICKKTVTLRHKTLQIK